MIYLFIDDKEKLLFSYSFPRHSNYMILADAQTNKAIF